LPPRPATSHEVVHVPRADAQVGHSTKVLHLVLTHFLILDEIDSHVSVRGIECHVIHKAEAMDHTRSTVVALIGGYQPGLLGRLYLLEQIRMITVFHAENIVQPMDMQCLD